MRCAMRPRPSARGVSRPPLRRATCERSFRFIIRSTSNQFPQLNSSRPTVPIRLQPSRYTRSIQYLVYTPCWRL
eukprot:6209706-Pleurochrysis_carterae.AAC.1